MKEYTRYGFSGLKTQMIILCVRMNEMISQKLTSNTKGIYFQKGYIHATKREWLQKKCIQNKLGGCVIITLRFL